MDDYKLDLDHALQLADVADNITMRVYRSPDMHVRSKADDSPVTQGDLEVEKELSEIVVEQFKESYIGEEGARKGAGNRVWTVDPIDGTRNFVRSMPIWGTLIALAENGETIAAAVSAPALGRRWWAAKGMGAWTKDTDGTVRRLRVSEAQELSDAFLLTATLLAWDTVPTGTAPVLQLMKQVWRNRALGDFLNYMMIAEGAADICIEAGAKGWDLAAPILIIQEAGGSVWTSATDQTKPGDLRTAIATNGLLEPTVRQTLKL